MRQSEIDLHLCFICGLHKDFLLSQVSVQLPMPAVPLAQSPGFGCIRAVFRSDRFCLRWLDLLVFAAPLQRRCWCCCSSDKVSVYGTTCHCCFLGCCCCSSSSSLSSSSLSSSSSSSSASFRQRGCSTPPLCAARSDTLWPSTLQMTWSSISLGAACPSGQACAYFQHKWMWEAVFKKCGALEGDVLMRGMISLLYADLPRHEPQEQNPEHILSEVPLSSTPLSCSFPDLQQQQSRQMCQALEIHTSHWTLPLHRQILHLWFKNMFRGKVFFFRIWLELNAVISEALKIQHYGNIQQQHFLSVWFLGFSTEILLYITRPPPPTGMSCLEHVQWISSTYGSGLYFSNANCLGLRPLQNHWVIEVGICQLAGLFLKAI